MGNRQGTRSPLLTTGVRALVGRGERRRFGERVRSVEREVDRHRGCVRGCRWLLRAVMGLPAMPQLAFPATA